MFRSWPSSSGAAGTKLASGARVDKPLAISRDEVLDAVEKAMAAG